MPTIIEKHVQERGEFLRRYRLAYLRSIGAEIGITDLRNVALREACAMIEIAADLLSREQATAAKLKRVQ